MIRFPRLGVKRLCLMEATRPLCVIETTEVKIQPYDKVDAQFAYEEGEGDRSQNQSPSYLSRVHRR
jgi:uncharacterized protein YhfF